MAMREGRDNAVGSKGARLEGLYRMHSINPRSVTGSRLREIGERLGDQLHTTRTP